MASRTGPPPAVGVAPPQAVRAADGGPATLEELPSPASAPRPLAETGAPDDLEKSWSGRGRIRGQVQVPEGLDFPDRWQLVLEPARFIEGSERAVGRIIDITDGSREFDVDDLPLGGYDVSARAAGMNGVPVAVLLYRFAGRDDLPGSTYSYVNLWMKPAGFLDGSVVDAAGVPVAGLPVFLRSTGDAELLETRSDPAGNFLFPVVLDGEYEILFGDASRPLRPAERFTFAAPSMRYPEREIPTTVDVTFRVFDERGYAIPDASIRGYAEVGGTIDLVTDDVGEARSRFLPLGDYRVTAKDRTGLRGKLNFETKALERTKVVEIVIKP